MKKVVGVLTLLLLMGAVGAHAGVITLTFEGLQDLEPVQNYYSAGFGGFGSGPGPNDGVVFTGNSLAIIDDDKGGTGNFCCNPSGKTILFFLSGTADTMNVAAGFTTGFSFFYSAGGGQGGFVNVWSGLNDT